MDEHTPEQDTQAAPFIPARPTLYKGIQMRSRLEANFAQHYLDQSFPGRWKYEPDCFASEAGQYLPDFSVGSVYIEVKPAPDVVCQSAPRPHGVGVDTSATDEILRKMEIIWASKPGALLWLEYWRYDAGSDDAICAAGSDRVWWWLHKGEWALWPGLGQYEAVARHRQGVGASDP
jgi:hypothetical protein